MKRTKQPFHAFLRAAAAAEQALIAYLQSLGSLCEAEYAKHHDDKAVSGTIFAVLLELAQLQKLWLRKERLFKARLGDAEEAVFQHSPDPPTLLDALLALKRLANRLWLSPLERKALYELFAENEQLYKKRMVIFLDPPCPRNDPATTWLAVPPTGRNSRDRVCK